jgi:hypothetical protein
MVNRCNNQCCGYSRISCSFSSRVKIDSAIRDMNSIHTVQRFWCASLQMSCLPKNLSTYTCGASERLAAFGARTFLVILQHSIRKDGVMRRIFVSCTNVNWSPPRSRIVKSSTCGSGSSSTVCLVPGIYFNIEQANIYKKCGIYLQKAFCVNVYGTEYLKILTFFCP